MSSSRKTLEQEINNDDVTNHRKLFGYNLPHELESHILEQLDLKTLAISRMVNSQWEAAVDNLSYLWLGLTRRLGIADACESGRERWRAQKMLGDCWVTSRVCPVGKESDTPERDLKLSHVRLNPNGKMLSVTAFDQRSLICHTWVLHLMPQSMPFSMTRRLWSHNVHEASDWVTLLAVGNVREPEIQVENYDGSFVSSDDSDKNSDGEIDFQAPINIDDDTIEVADNDDTIASSPVDAENAEDRTEAFDLRIPGPITERAAVDYGKSLYAILSLRRTRTDSVFPLALIEIPSHEHVVDITSQPCKHNSCSETQVLVLTNRGLLLYSLAPPSESTDASTLRPILSSPHASISFAQTPGETLCRLKGMSIVTLDSNASSNDRCPYFAIVYMIVNDMINKKFIESLSLVRIDCGHIQLLSTVQLPDTYIIYTSMSTQTLLLCWVGDTLDVYTCNQMRLLRYSVFEQNSLQLDYDPCEYHGPPWIFLEDHIHHFEVGQRFWFCIGGNNMSMLLAIYLIGSPEPLILVNISDIIPRRPIMDQQYDRCTASTWIDFGFELDSPDLQTPLIAMGCENDMNFLIGWCCGPPKWYLSSRCLSARISRSYKLDWPWLMWRRTAAKQDSHATGFN